MKLGVWFGLVGFYGISTIVGVLMLDALYTFIVKYIYVYALSIIFLNEPEFFIAHGFKYCNITVTI